MKRLLLFFCVLLLSFIAGGARAQAEPGRMRLLVTPFENHAAAQSQSAYALGIPAALAERFEDDPDIEVINGPLVLTREQATLVTRTGGQYDLHGANELALARGATHFLTGRYSGQVWKWTLEVDLYKAWIDGPERVGHGSVLGDLNKPGTTVQGSEQLHALLAKAAADAFNQAGRPLSTERLKAIETPSTGDSYAFLKLSRAYVRYFNDADDGTGDTAIGIAEYAVRVDPKYAEAQRFYATLLLADEQTKKARIHFEFAVQVRPKDTRSLIALGKLEIDQKNPEIARGYLGRAIVVHPKDPEPRYWLGMALLDLKEVKPATDAFESARILNPGYLDARRELVKIYSDARRYADAAGELSVMASVDPRDPEIRFLLAASYRAAGDPSRAMDVYFAAAGAFPKEARYRKFLGDLLKQQGRAVEAAREFAAAAALAPNDKRATALAHQAETPLIGGDGLTEAIIRATDTAAQMEHRRSRYQMAINDAVLDLQLNKEKGCLDGRAASSAILAREEGKVHAELGSRLTDLAGAVKTASSEGEWSSLTTDERSRAAKALGSMAAAERDVREMRGQFDRQFVPLYRSFKCETYDGPLNAATLDDVRKHMLEREVTWPPVKAPLYLMPFTPVIDPESGRIVRFAVNNKAGRQDYVLSIDGTVAGTIPAGSSLTFTARIGLHRLCLVPKDATCDPARDDRLIRLHDGWTIRVRPAT